MNININKYLYSFKVIKEYGSRVYVDPSGREILCWKHRGVLTLNELYVDYEIVNKIYLSTDGYSRLQILKAISKWFVDNEDEISVNRYVETSPEKFPKT